MLDTLQNLVVAPRNEEDTLTVLGKPLAIVDQRTVAVQVHDPRDLIYRRLDSFLHASQLIHQRLTLGV
jgi:hypothetical protein